jgi:acetolactate synthase I/II/III large subunit
MNGAEKLLKTAVQAGIEVCFTNPGTTELPLVAAFDSISGIRPYLGLFEGCCTGAADGYGRMADKPAMTLLHLGPGLSYGIANLHNARRAQTPILNVIGEHASWHRAADAPITMDIQSLAGTVSGWRRTSTSTETLSRDTADAIQAAQQGQVATLIVPHDYQEKGCTDQTISFPPSPVDAIGADSIARAAMVLKKGLKTLLILGGCALRKPGLEAAARIKAKTGCDLIAQNFPPRIERGCGLLAVDRIPYFPRRALALLAKYQAVILAGAEEPVAFFGYEGCQSKLLSKNQKAIRLAASQRNIAAAIEQLAEAVGASQKINGTPENHPKLQRPHLPTGRLTASNACLILAALQPEDAIIVDESITAGTDYYPLTASVPPHTLLTLPGGAIGYGMPCAVGAAIACPDRPVINFQADGSAMYTVQSLWMQAREGCNITTLICSNRSYDILKIELARSGIESAGPFTRAVMELDHPQIDWVRISKGMGVPAAAVDTSEQLTRQLKFALNEPGPHLIEMVI